jgi:hypothetical protein
MTQVGCNKEVFPQWAARVLALGYSVGRVEEVPQSKGKVGRHAAWAPFSLVIIGSRHLQLWVS